MKNNPKGRKEEGVERRRGNLKEVSLGNQKE